MTRGVASPRKTVLRNSRATQKASTHESMMIANIMLAALCGKNVPTNSRYTGSLAPQAM